MTGRPEALFLAHRIPYPPNKGDKIRSWRLLQFLAAHYDVHLAAFVDDPADMQYREKLESVAATVTLERISPAMRRLASARAILTGGAQSMAYYHSSKFAAAINRIRERSLVAEIAFSSTMAQYIARRVGDRRRIVDFCDADAEKWLEYSEGAAFPLSVIYRREGEKLQAAETEIANWADASFAITSDEAAIFNRRSGAARSVRWFGNGVDTSFFDPQAIAIEAEHKADVVFSGAMDYRANVDAVVAFMAEVWPLVRTAKKDARFTIVGANPVRAVRAYDGVDGVRVTGRVDDIRPWIAGAKLSVAPLRIARGVQNKVLEGMAMARAVVASPAAAAGVRFPEGALVVAADPAAMAAEILALLDDDERRRRIGAAARAHIIAAYQWKDQFSPLADALGLAGSGSISPASVAAAS